MIASSNLFSFSLTFSLFPFSLLSVFCHNSPPSIPFVVVHLCLPLLSLFPPFISPLAFWATLAVEIKEIKDLPWPPPVGQLNTSPPPVEELESPSQTAQPSPGQTSCDQHHQGGCWCSHCLASFLSATLHRPPILTPFHPSVYQPIMHPFTHILLYFCLSVWDLCGGIWTYVSYISVLLRLH